MPQDQPALLREQDLRITRAVVGQNAVYRSESWISNGVWAMSTRRIANDSILYCPHCLHQFTGNRSVFQVPTSGMIGTLNTIERRFEAIPTPRIHTHQGQDFVLFDIERSDWHRESTFYVPRVIVEQFGLNVLYVESDSTHLQVAADDQADPTFLVAINLVPREARLPAFVMQGIDLVTSEVMRLDGINAWETTQQAEGPSVIGHPESLEENLLADIESEEPPPVSRGDVLEPVETIRARANRARRRRDLIDTLSSSAVVEPNEASEPEPVAGLDAGESSASVSETEEPVEPPTSDAEPQQNEAPTRTRNRRNRVSTVASAVQSVANSVQRAATIISPPGASYLPPQVTPQVAELNCDYLQQRLRTSRLSGEVELFRETIQRIFNECGQFSARRDGWYTAINPTETNIGDASRRLMSFRVEQFASGYALTTLVFAPVRAENMNRLILTRDHILIQLDGLRPTHLGLQVDDLAVSPTARNLQMRGQIVDQATDYAVWPVSDSLVNRAAILYHGRLQLANPRHEEELAPVEPDPQPESLPANPVTEPIPAPARRMATIAPGAVIVDPGLRRWLVGDDPISVPVEVWNIARAMLALQEQPRLPDTVRSTAAGLNVEVTISPRPPRSRRHGIINAITWSEEEERSREFSEYNPALASTQSFTVPRSEFNELVQNVTNPGRILSANPSASRVFVTDEGGLLPIRAHAGREPYVDCVSVHRFGSGSLAALMEEESIPSHRIVSFTVEGSGYSAWLDSPIYRIRPA